MLAKELLTMVSACINITQKDRQNQSVLVALSEYKNPYDSSFTALRRSG